MTRFYNTNQPDSSQDLKGFYGINVRPAEILNYVKMAQDAAKRSEEARDESRAARDESQGYAQDSANSATASKASRVAAEAAQTGAEAAETNASNSAALAATEANRATTQADRAESEADRAEQYANSMANGMVFRGDWDASTNTFPTPTLSPEKADYYRITVGGTITGSGSQPTLELLVGDDIVWHTVDDIWIRVAARVTSGVSAALQAQRDRLQDMFAASGFVHYGLAAIRPNANEPVINEGMYSMLTTPNVLGMGRDYTDWSGTSKSPVPVSHIAGFITKWRQVSDSGIISRTRIKLPEAPDGSIIEDTSGDARGTGQYNLDLLNEVDPKYGNTASTQNEAVARAFEGSQYNGDIRMGITGWNDQNGKIVQSNGTLVYTHVAGQEVSYENIVDYRANFPAGTELYFEYYIDNPSGASVRFNLSGSTASEEEIHTRSGFSSGTCTVVNATDYPQIRVEANSPDGAQVTLHHLFVRQVTESVITERVDMYGTEHWLEAITPTKPQCYPYGLPQQLGVNVDGIPTQAGTRPATYYSWFKGDLNSVGNEWDFFALSVIQQDAILNNPDHNVYYSNGKYLQWRARGKSFRGRGNGDWENVDPLVDGLKYSQFATVVPQGMKDVAPAMGTVDAYMSYQYHTTNTFVKTPNLGVFVASDTQTGVAVDGECYFHVWGQVQRLNQGAYHPSHNSLGTDATSNGNYWYSVANFLTSPSDCFTKNYGEGNIGGVTGHPDGLRYDAIYPSGQGGVLDDRLSAWDMSSFEEAMKVDFKVKNGTYRGKQKLPFTDVSTYTTSSGGVGSAIAVTDMENYPIGTIIYVQNVGGTYEERIVDGRDGSSGSGTVRWTLYGGINLVTSGHVVRTRLELTNISVEGNKDNGFICQDVTGDPADLAQEPDLMNGWQGHWIPTWQTSSGFWDYPLSRKQTRNLGTNNLIYKAFGSHGADDPWVASTLNDGTGGNQINTTTNTIRIGAGMSIYSYEAMPYVVEDGTNDVVFNSEQGVGDVCQLARHNYSILMEGLIGKVGTSQGSKDLGTLKIKSLTIDHSNANGSIEGKLSTTSNYFTKHEPVDMTAPTNYSPAVKALVYQTSVNQRLGLNYAFNELKYSILSATDISGSSTAQKSVGVTYRVTSGRFEGQYMTCTQATTAAFDNAIWQLLPDGRVISSATSVVNFRLWQSGWNDDGTIQIASGTDTGENLAGETILIGTKSLTKPYGYSRNQARISTQVEGIDL